MAKQNQGTKNQDDIKTESLSKSKTNNTIVFWCYIVGGVAGNILYMSDLNSFVVSVYAWVIAIPFNGIMSVTHWFTPTTIETQEAYGKILLGGLVFGSVVLGIYSNRQNRIS